MWAILYEYDVFFGVFILNYENFVIVLQLKNRQQFVKHSVTQQYDEDCDRPYDMGSNTLHINT